MEDWITTAPGQQSEGQDGLQDKLVTATILLPALSQAIFRLENITTDILR